MVQITIDIPEALAERLAAVRDRLPEVLAHGLDTLSPIPNEIYRSVLAFLASNPPPDAVLHFSPTSHMEARIRTLLEKHRAEQLTPAEAEELDEYSRIDNLIALLKAQAFQSLRAPA